MSALPHLKRSIGVKIFGAFVVMGLMTILLSAYGLYVLIAAGDIVAATYDGPLMAINFARSAALTFVQMDKEELRRSISGATEQPEIDRKLRDLTASFFEDLAVAEQRSLAADEQPVIEEIHQLVSRWDLLRQRPSSNGVEVELEMLAEKIVKQCDVLIELIADHSFIERRKSVTAIESFQHISIAAALLILLLSTSITLLLARGIVRPFSAAASIADRIAGGELETPIPIGGKDESGILLRSMTVMQDNIRQMMEREKAANRAKSQFLATMSHEIRTPMNGVVGTANLLATTPLNDRQTQLVHNLVGSGQALLGIINDILDLSKIEAGHFELAMVEFDPRELIAEISDLFSERCTSKGIEFIYFVAEEVPHRLTGDPARLRQVLINLVGNAIKFTERGEILVELSLTDSTQQHATLHCSVTDTGIGIDPEQRAKIFEAFYQVDRSMTRLRGGTGLGLSIVKELVTLMGGDIGVESELGHGSRFWFTTRFDRSDDELAATRSPRALERPLRALAVDANAVSAEVMSRYFTSWRIDSWICASAAEAETALQDAEASKRPFDAVIIDVKGLTGEGVKLARKIRIEQQGRRPEVILLMGLDGSVSDNSLESLGAFALLTKPARPSMLFDCLASIASGSRENGIASFYVRKSGAQSKVAFDARILVVEDNAVNLDVASGILKQMGCSIVTASNGRSAVQLFAQETFDLILMDCEMPIMDGFDATRHMRDIERVMHSRTPIVALTAHALAEVRERCLEAGMDDFLVKPYDELQIADILGRWLTPRTAIMPAPGSDMPVGEERPSSPAAATRLDMVAVDRIRWISGDDGSSLLGQVISQFTAVSGPLLATMRAKSRDSDPQAVWRAAHSLKSSASAIGACRVSQYCEEIEALARDNGILPNEAVIAALAGEVVAAIGELNRLVSAEQGAA